jgi:hypothetical protein
MKVRVIDLYTDKNTGTLHTPGEQFVINDAARVKELIAASVVEQIEGEADPVPEEAPAEAPKKAPVKKATATKKRVKKDE